MSSSTVHSGIMWQPVIIFMAAYIWGVTEAYFTNFNIKRLEVCNNTQREIKYDGRIRNHDGKQYFDWNLTLPFPVGDSIRAEFLIETKTIGNNFVELFTIREKDICKALSKYLGEFWYDIERQTLITPGVCPIQQGKYHGHNIELHFEKISLQTFPFGTLRFTMQAIDKINKKCVWCILIEVDNVVN